MFGLVSPWGRPHGARMPRRRTRGPLTGLRVLDLSNSPAGSQASQTLADFGAEVVQVEPPGGSPLRDLPSFPMLGRGKKSMVLDLHDAGRRRSGARSMALGADVLIETFRPGVMERFGLGYEELSSVNPRLVYGSVTGFGRTGPYAGAKGYEALVMARVGALWASQAMVTREGPAHVSVPYCSYGASQQLLTGICAALHERERQRPGSARRRHAGQRAGVARHVELVSQRHHVEVPRRLHALVAHRPARDPADPHGLHAADRAEQGRALARSSPRSSCTSTWRCSR